MIRDFEIGFFEKGAYERKLYEEPFELVGCQGSISTKGETTIHIHCSVAGPDHGVIGGHLNSATVHNVNEIFIRRFTNVKLDRVLNPETGLKELSVG